MNADTPSIFSISAFFLLLVTHYRHLHSFPTRRSSDLKPTFTPHLQSGDFVIVINAEKIAVTGRRLDQKVYYHNHEIDRKSTRLNSSHITISYAVFCLKKKTTTAGSSGCGGGPRNCPAP